MKSLFNLSAVIALIVIISSCSKNSNEKTSTDNKEKQKVKSDSIMKMTAGDYSGMLPCADCEGIWYNVSLLPDMNFTSKMIYIGRTVDPLQAKGVWRIMDDTLIMLQSTTDVPSFLKILSKDSLLMLDDSLKRMKGPVESMFVLRRGDSLRVVSNDTASGGSTIPNKNYILDSLNGTKVSEKDYMNGLPELKIDSKNNTVSGSTGCNRLNGKVIIKNDEISFSSFAMTRMMCPGSGEADFIESLKSVNRYKMQNLKLYLMNGDKIILALSEKK